MEKKVFLIEATESEASALATLGFNPVPHVAEPDPSMILPTMTDGAQDQAIEPENIDKIESTIPDPFVKAQISTKNQMILRNILAALSSIGVVIVFILEKLGIM